MLIIKIINTNNHYFTLFLVSSIYLLIMLLNIINHFDLYSNQEIFVIIDQSSEKIKDNLIFSSTLYLNTVNGQINYAIINNFETDKWKLIP